MNRKEVLEQTIKELVVLGLAMQVSGDADPRTENPISALVDAVEDPATGRSIAGQVEQMLHSELDSTYYFADADAVLEFRLASERFIGALTQIGIVTEKNKPAVDKVAKEVYSRAIQMYAEQWRKQENQKGYASAKPARYDTEGRLR